MKKFYEELELVDEQFFAQRAHPTWDRYFLVPSEYLTSEALMLDAIVGTLVYEIQEEYKAANAPLPLLNARRRKTREAKDQNKAYR